MNSTAFKVFGRPLLAAFVSFALLLASSSLLAQNVDLVVTIESDQPAYMGEDLEHFTVVVTNNGPATATSVLLVVEHGAADQPFETSATCQALSGPHGPGVCPAGSGSAPSAAFVRVDDTTFSTTIPSIPSQAGVVVEFENTSRCPSRQGGAGSDSCFGIPSGNYVVSADVSSAETELDEETNHASTNIFIYPPDVQFKIEIVDYPVTANPGDVVEYEFEVTSFGLHPSDLLRLQANVRGLAGDMTPLSWSNHPLGPNGSTLADTELQAIECLSMSLGSYPAGEVFAGLTDPWNTCPPIGTYPIPIPVPVSNDHSSPIWGFPAGFYDYFLANLPGTLDGPPGGGVMRFKAEVEVGEPVCGAVPEAGYRELEFAVRVHGLNGTDTVPPGPADNQDAVITQVPHTCEEADIELLTVPQPAVMTLDGNGQATWTQVTTVSNLSVGATAGTATQVPVRFGHHSAAFKEIQQGPVLCNSVPNGLCPTPAELAAGVVWATDTAFRLETVIASLPPGAVVTFEQVLTEERTECWNSTGAPIDLRGDAGPSALFDPVYSPAFPVPPPSFTPGNNVYYGNNGSQTIASINGLDVCPGNGGGDVDIEVQKFGPYATAADAQIGGALIGQTSATAIPDDTEIFFRIEVSNPNAINPVRLSQVIDTAFTGANLLGNESGFVHTGPNLADWGITCIPSSPSAICHDQVGTPGNLAHTSQLNLLYDPDLHAGEDALWLPPGEKLTYILPFVTPSFMDQCYNSQKDNRAQVRFEAADGSMVTSLPSIVNFHVGNPPCSSGVLEVVKAPVAPATTSFIPASGELSFSVVLSNLSATETLDVAHLVDDAMAFGVDITVTNIQCVSLSNGAICPSTPVVPGMKTPASGSPTPLAEAWAIDHEWGQPGDNTFPPNSSLEFIITYQLANPDRTFSCISNSAVFSGENDPNGWVPDQMSTGICPPPAPELSLQKKVSPQIAPPGSTVTYTLIVTNIGSADADGSVLFDALPPALLADNPSGYTNVTCTDITGNGFVPNPQGVAVCPPVTSDASGLSATIATFGANTALQFTYQAVVPDVPIAPVSIDNTAVLTPNGPGGLSFSAGSSSSRQNLQVLGPGAPPIPAIGVPVASKMALIALMMLLLALGMATLQWRRMG